MSRARPNILITGTPGTGKTTTSEMVAQELGFTHINVGDWVREKALHSGWNQEFECFNLDEDKVCDALEDPLAEGGNVVDYHGCDFFPERWFDLVIVLQTNNTQLFDRLQKRGYSAKKVSENVECEIMMVVMEEAAESYRSEIVKPLPSDTTDDLERNVATIAGWVRGMMGAAR
ncbi:putative adenylate kinase isoenzyme 6 [Tetrabaena socialis]|uniref:Adenylate kinase isoenzyme 6 homolog n=1 Tax=Tetrabaena socialis TaxID=47790 RepID=A0A2J8A428_9CHLO|nr:putative adenylate kinase isoenzyme 6 [Tetrabaena socialis]|eukprot:PNH07276.1 putative adenylate kinase isoenzyme 6 [Tetrabaena socialis]